MPNCFQLIRKSDLNAGPVDLTKLDEDIVAQFPGAEVHPTDYYNGWFDAIGFPLSCEKTFEDIHNQYTTRLEEADKTDESHVKWLATTILINRYLMQNFDSNAFYSR